MAVSMRAFLFICGGRICAFRSRNDKLKMASTPLSEFYTPLRTLLGDTDPYEVYDRLDTELDGALRSVFVFGKAPDGYALEGGNRATAAAIAPEVPNGDDFALIAYEAALLLVGGECADSYRTRGLSVSRSGGRRNSLLMELKLKVREIREGGDCFATMQSFVTWLAGLSSLSEETLAGSPAPTLPQIGIPDFPL